jgi:hypothetical protein
MLAGTLVLSNALANGPHPHISELKYCIPILSPVFISRTVHYAVYCQTADKDLNLELGTSDFLIQNVSKVFNNLSYVLTTKLQNHWRSNHNFL